MKIYPDFFFLGQHHCSEEERKGMKRGDVNELVMIKN